MLNPTYCPGGNISQLPQSVDLIVGPGFKDEFLPGYPAKEGSPFWESDFKGRNVIEAPFNMKLGQYDAYDYFGDGSLYILDVPGHATAHISALVRTTPDTAIFMGGDVCHFTGDNFHYSKQWPMGRLAYYVTRRRHSAYRIRTSSRPDPCAGSLGSASSKAMSLHCIYRLPSEPRGKSDSKYCGTEYRRHR